MQVGKLGFSEVCCGLPARVATNYQVALWHCQFCLFFMPQAVGTAMPQPRGRARLSWTIISLRLFIDGKQIYVYCQRRPLMLVTRKGVLHLNRTCVFQGRALWKVKMDQGRQVLQWPTFPLGCLYISCVPQSTEPVPSHKKVPSSIYVRY